MGSDQCGGCYGCEDDCMDGVQSAKDRIGGFPSSFPIDTTIPGGSGGSFSSVEKDDIIIRKFSRTNMNLMGNVVADASSDWNVPAPGSWSEVSGHDFMYASDVNNLVDLINTKQSGQLSPSDFSVGRSFQKDDILYAADFDKILQAIFNLQLQQGSCEVCDTDSDQCDMYCCDCDCDSD